MNFLQIKEVLLAALLLITSPTGFAQSLNTQNLDTYLQTLEENQKFMGSVAILKEGKVIYDKQVGYSTIESNQTPNKETKYRIGSISKLFTASLIFIAVEEGKITLNQTIDSYFPEIKNAPGITISNLLNHSSGIHNYTDNKKVFLSYHSTPKTEKEMLEIIVKGGSDFSPNSTSAYSNSNYVLLSYILERLYKKPFSKILEDKITIPLNLKNTFFGTKIKPDSNEACAYRFEKKWQKTNETDPSIDMGAGGIVSTPTDLIRFADAIFKHKLISPQSVATMKTIHNKFGMGLFKIDYFNEPSYGHNGEIDGFNAVLRYFPEKDIAFAITSNALNYSLNELTVCIVKSIYNQPIYIPDFRVYKPKRKELKQYIGTYKSDSFPVAISVTRSENQLYIQAPGDSKIKLQANALHQFSYAPALLKLIFIPEKNQLEIYQNGKKNTLLRE